MPDFLIRSALNRKISARLVIPFNIMTTFFFRRSVEKAFQLDESPSGLSLNPSKALHGNPPYIISAVDDVMYIVNTVLQRSISTSQKDIIASVIPTIGRVLGSDFVGMIQRKMRDESYPKPVIQGGFPPEDKIIAFIVLINSLDVTNDYVTRIVSSRLEPQTNELGSDFTTRFTELFPFDHEAAFMHTTLATLNTNLASKISELIDDGLLVLFNQVIKPRLRHTMSDAFRDVDYFVSSEELAEMTRGTDADTTGDDIVTRRFENSWDALMKPIGRLMTERTFASLLDQTARYLTKVLEKRVWSFTGRSNGLGAVRMERDFAGIVGVVCRGGKYGIREVFSRVLQILMVVNMEEDEWEEVRAAVKDGEEGMSWVISEEERIRARSIVKE
jgi:conserved oligomeric Golgi complex subunit 4